MEKILPGGAIEAWNKQCPGEVREIRPGDSQILHVWAQKNWRNDYLDLDPQVPFGGLEKKLNTHKAAESTGSWRMLVDESWSVSRQESSWSMDRRPARQLQRTSRSKKASWRSLWDQQQNLLIPTKKKFRLTVLYKEQLDQQKPVGALKLFFLLFRSLKPCEMNASTSSCWRWPCLRRSLGEVEVNVVG